MFCILDCAFGWYGPGCLSQCRCEDDCDKVSGICPTRCQRGWTGNTCQKRKQLIYAIRYQL